MGVLPTSRARWQHGHNFNLNYMAQSHGYRAHPIAVQAVNAPYKHNCGAPSLSCSLAAFSLQPPAPNPPILTRNLFSLCIVPCVYVNVGCDGGCNERMECAHLLKIKGEVSARVLHYDCPASHQDVRMLRVRVVTARVGSRAGAVGL
jgi:hypothetical protein